MRLQATIRRQSSIVRTTRLRQVEGLFDLTPDATESLAWPLDVTLPDTWSIGAIVGPSGAGKSTVASEIAKLLGGELLGGKNADGTDKPLWPWPADKSIVDGFPASLGIKEVTGLLSSVGFSSPPAWRRPFHVLSNGQQFRVNLARTLAECPALAVVDEFTSVIDRQVAMVGSAAVAKTVRRRGGKVIAVSCHTDILDWLEPDWVLEIFADGQCELQTNDVADATRGSVRRWRRPPIELEIVRTDRSVWPIFAPHHYLSSALSLQSQCFITLHDGKPAAFTAAIAFPHAKRPGFREHRTVCLPDFQGVGIGNAMSEFVASLYVSRGTPYFSTTSHPAMIRHRARSPLWKTVRQLAMGRPHKGGRRSVRMAQTNSVDRLSAGFEYVGPARREEAKLMRVARPRET